MVGRTTGRSKGTLWDILGGEVENLSRPSGANMCMTSTRSVPTSAIPRHGFDKELLLLGVSGGDNGRSIIEHVMDFGFASRVRGSRNAGTRGIRLVVSDLLDALAFG